MTPEEFLDAVREENKTALSRLGSSKSLYAETQGEMEADAVLSTAAAAAESAAETFDGWADDEPHEGARELFAATADGERDHLDTVVGEVDAYEPGEPAAIDGYLRSLDRTVERVGGVIGWALVADKATEQRVGFFVGQADPGTSRLFRGIREDVEQVRDRGASVLDDVCDSEEDWDRALEAANGAIQTAYDEYFETLEAMGVNPKPVC